MALPAEYLHLGGDVLVRRRDIVGVFDLDNTSTSKWTRRFLSQAEKDGQVVSATEDVPKSFVLCCGRGGTVLYLSQLSASTVKKRSLREPAEG